MKLTIEIDLDNAAFEDNGWGEIVYCLSQVTRKLNFRGRIVADDCKILDTNGNTVGTATVSD
jgi:hypothetical protein